MGMEEFHESLRGTIIYYGRASCCFGQHLSRLAVGCSLNYIKILFCSFSCNKIKFEQICHDISSYKETFRKTLLYVLNEW
jgi:hypothetical protein